MATSFRLEADFLERLGGVPVETRCLAVEPRRAARSPSATHASVRWLIGELLCSRVSRQSTLPPRQSSALQQRSSQYELRRTDLVEVVIPTLQKLQSAFRARLSAWSYSPRFR